MLLKKILELNKIGVEFHIIYNDYSGFHIVTLIDNRFNQKHQFEIDGDIHHNDAEELILIGISRFIS
jgi:hypothetical protein